MSPFVGVAVKFAMILGPSDDDDDGDGGRERSGRRLGGRVLAIGYET